VPAKGVGLSMRSKHTVFAANYITTKQELLHSISEYIVHCKEDGNKEEKWSNEKVNTIIQLCEALCEKIEDGNIPKLSNWWYYNYCFTNYEIVLKMCHCSEVSYDQEGWIYESTIDEVFPLIKIPCKMLSVPDFAKRFGVRESTVLHWIKKAKIRYIKKHGNNWMISELADKPTRKYHSVVYKWQSPIPQLQTAFDFLENYTHVYIEQNKNVKGSYTVFMGFPGTDNRKIVTLPSIERERLELALLSLHEVTVEEIFNSIMYVPLKAEEVEKDKIYEKLLRHNPTIEKDNYVEYGTVIVTKGVHKGRIGFYDDDDDKNCIVYFGNMLYTNWYYEIKSNALSNTIPTAKLLDRIENLQMLLFNAKGSKYDYQRLLEMEYCNNMLNERYINAVYAAPNGTAKVFISHAKEDLALARTLATDLKASGYDFFLDDWSIELGENIAHEISVGIDTSSALIPIISSHFIKSVFCLDEWTSYYNKFAKLRPNSIYPIIIGNSTVPSLLAARKYIRFESADDYGPYLDRLLKGLKKHQA
jgi:hypothetical protein